MNQHWHQYLSDNRWRRETMNELHKKHEPEKHDPHEQDLIQDSADPAGTEAPAPEPGLRERLRTLFANLQQRGPVTKRELAKDRTRPLALLIGGTVGAVLLFI